MFSFLIDEKEILIGYLGICIDERVAHDEIFVRIGIEYHGFLSLQGVIWLPVPKKLASAYGEAKVYVWHNLLFIYHNVAYIKIVVIFAFEIS